MNKTILAIITFAVLATKHAHADENNTAHAFSANAAISSDYRYRGISQTRLRPALSGGVDYNNASSGVYAGAWASSITWTKDAGGGGQVELDLYAGQRGKLGGAISYDIGALTYIYPSNGLQHVAGFAGADTTEIYGQLGYGVAYLKYAHAVTNLFGFIDSKNSSYIDLGANIDMTSTTVLNLHAGLQNVEHNPTASYRDWKIGLTHDLGFASATLALVGTNANKTAYASPINGKFTGKRALVLGLGKTF
ncbi:TorF family putative porin [Massilia sp. CF038]|uniref:TorF family putative porin n=1 Tax=Massilia sp. CF038 TaxID=1881045 RepID=UPI000920E7DA|nr:TorF family putative porin [Massilia sp. CF038]SHH19716.1 conserved hypothetical protein [Massilia sp. CF038]